MPVTSQPTDQPTGQLITDQKALERLFRENYARLVAEAKGRLGDAVASAPRVVSKAFHLAWQDRKRFHSFDELNAFLGAQIHHGATREISRRAGLHRMDHHEGLGGGAHVKHETHEMTVDEAWERLEHTLQGGAPDAYRARASTARHEAAEHVKGLAAKKKLKPAIISGVVGLAAVLAAVWYVLQAGEEDRVITQALAAQDARATEMGAGQIANVTLDDGTVARLAPESKLTVPRRFGLGLRAVRIDGAANFNVPPVGSGEPFQVRAGKVAIIAVGTNFTVRKYRDEETVLVHVREGSVDVRFGETIRDLTQGQSISVADDGTMSVPRADELQEATTWVDGTVTIPGRQLRYVLPQMKRWYGLDIKVQDLTLLDREVFLSAPMDSKTGAIASIEQSGGVKFTYIGENMAFEDAASSRSTKP